MEKEIFSSSNSDTEKKKSGQSFFNEFIKFALIALLIVLPIRLFIAQPFIVSGASMHPTFKNGEYLIVDEISYRFQNPERGDVIVFKFPEDPSKFFIKRIIGLPNETIEIVRGSVFITNEENPEGFQIEENYILNKSFETSSFQTKEGEYFVMGDNRIASLDSRSWGPLPENLVKGVAFLRLLPISKISIMPGADEDY